MAYRQNEILYHRIALKEEFNRRSFTAYAFSKYWHLTEFSVDNEVDGFLAEFICSPASKTILIDYIEDNTTPLPYIFIRPQVENNQQAREDAEKVFREMMRLLPVYHLSELIDHFKLISTIGPVNLDEIYALGKGYDAFYQQEIFDTLTVLANHDDAQVSMAVVLAVGYISQPFIFNAVLKLLVTHQNIDVAMEAQRMIRAGETVNT